MKRRIERFTAFIMAIRMCFRKDHQNTLYELMTQFAIATLYRYRKEIVLSPVAGERPSEFAQKNADIVQRVRDEAKSLYNYKLTPAQVHWAIKVYLAPSLSVRNTPVATREVKS